MSQTWHVLSLLDTSLNTSKRQAVLRNAYQIIVLGFLPNLMSEDATLSLPHRDDHKSKAGSSSSQVICVPSEVSLAWLMIATIAADSG